MIGLRRSYTARSRDFSGIAARQFWDLEGEGGLLHLGSGEGVDIHGGEGIEDVWYYFSMIHSDNCTYLKSNIIAVEI
jgi:hypothetical protein